ncbi:GTP cyclohydrolase I FolE [Halioglobus japonicus]|uniref:GTP cyclohydrolase 1 n=1 Tax=Halioglobus japonicus TaxID=930805 RepID=A0AAP8SNY9_9GAMM|nr:GTP cyclohydrolase I FolE [Halioglobus japonicus]AQA18574.1 GTP cyclohydrolase I FolE [Halioglobus japonicus]PLW86598.1 GTP cyclohydrolase I FolE [Halioglobus japonicus]GHD12048.1 GTP cyclohydrolase 1 [Halioglobus japonicus]
MNAITSPALNREADFSPEALAVREALIAHGLETPLVANGLSSEEQYKRLQQSFTDIMNVLGLDLRDDSLSETPHRMASMYLNDLFAGLDYGTFPKISSIENKMGVDEMVLIDDIELISTCEHHFVTIDGFARVAYVPNERVIGLSKINRLVRFFARRPQVQERLTRQIQVALQTLLETDDVAVLVQATHYCVKSRGVMDASSSTRTQALGGVFRTNDNERRSFLG